ncbi:MAG: zinc ribbon domain-containing protein [Clostridia bacterium]|nr:zinc ribbon domain-containing protein [Clostridia bacterium]
MKKILILFICTVLLFSFSACDNNPQQDQPNTDIHETNNQGNEDENLSQDNSFESKLLPSATFLDRGASFAVIDNEIKSLTGFYNGETYKNQVFAIKCDRFAFLKDGSVIDLWGDYAEENRILAIKDSFEPESWDRLLEALPHDNTEALLTDLNKSVGITNIIEYVDNGYYHVFDAMGNVYRMYSDYAVSLTKLDNPVLNTDGTLNCPQFPETEEWTDIVDYRMASNFILALTSDGKLLSSGIEFEHENIVKFDIWDVCTWDAWDTNYGDLPIALTADGNLIFGELTSRDQVPQDILKNWDKQIETAKTFTDVEDFTFYGPNDDLYIIVQKTDGSIWATQYIDVFSEYVNYPDGVEISHEEEILAERLCSNCGTIIPQNVECPECGAP